MKSYIVIYPSVDDCINNYRCVVNGDDIVAIGSDFKPIRRKCESFARHGFYVELWYMHSDGSSVLVNYWN